MPDISDISDIEEILDTTSGEKVKRCCSGIMTKAANCVRWVMDKIMCVDYDK